MTKYFESILTNFRSWKESKVEQPLSPENAYSLSSIGKMKSMQEILNNYKKLVLKEIKEVASFGHTYILIEYPDYLCADHKNQIVDILATLGYRILYNNQDIMVVSWKVE